MFAVPTVATLEIDLTPEREEVARRVACDETAELVAPDVSEVPDYVTRPWLYGM
jgi:hypothetical protein